MAASISLRMLILPSRARSLRVVSGNSSHVRGPETVSIRLRPGAASKAASDRPVAGRLAAKLQAADATQCEKRRESRLCCQVRHRRRLTKNAIMQVAVMIGLDGFEAQPLPDPGRNLRAWAICERGHWHWALGKAGGPEIDICSKGFSQLSAYFVFCICCAALLERRWLLDPPYLASSWTAMT